MKLTLTYVLLLTATLALLVAGLYVGSFATNAATLRAALLHFDADNPAHVAIVQLRLPRLLLALLAGGSLALSGYLMQALVNNPLADPYLLGTASAASLGANLAFAGVLPLVVAGVYAPPLWAFGGAMGVTLLVVRLAYSGGQIVPTQLLLAGVALSSLMTAAVSLLAFRASSDGQLRSVLFWSLGSFERAQWSDLPALAALLAVATLGFGLLHRHLTTLLLGESRAHYLGLNLPRLRWGMLSGAALLTAVAVASAGPIGFVGLVVPHVVRRGWGVSHAANTGLVVWLGALFALGCDLVARLLLPPAGLPVGIVTSFLGIPFFVYLLWKRRFRFS